MIAGHTTNLNCHLARDEKSRLHLGPTAMDNWTLDHCGVWQIPSNYHSTRQVVITSHRSTAALQYTSALDVYHSFDKALRRHFVIIAAAASSLSDVIVRE